MLRLQRINKIILTKWLMDATMVTDRVVLNVAATREDLILIALVFELFVVALVIFVTK